jgi:hypothetical protein
MFNPHIAARLSPAAGTKQYCDGKPEAFRTSGGGAVLSKEFDAAHNVYCFFPI